MIFAAGLGTRLRPLTNDKPKALVQVEGMPLLEILIRRLIWFGVDEIIVNVHHFSDQIISFLKANKNFNINIQVSDESELLLDTGGGLKKAAPFFDDNPFLVINTDIISNLNLKAFYSYHLRNQGIATIATRNRSTSRYFLFNELQELVGWTNVKTKEIKTSKPSHLQIKRAFSGIHIISPKLFEYFPDEAIFSIVDVYLHAAKTESIYSFEHDEDLWIDVGKIPELEKAKTFLRQIELA